MKLPKKNLKIVLIVLLTALLLVCLIFFAYFAVRSYHKVNQFRVAMEAFQAKDYPLAKKLFSMVLAGDRNNETAVVKLAEIAEENDNPPEMVYFRFRALKLNALNTDYFQRYIHALLRARQFRELEVQLKTISAGNRTPEQTLLLAFSSFRLGHRREAQTLWDNLKKEKPEALNTPLGKLIGTMFLSREKNLNQLAESFTELSKVADPMVALEALLGLATVQSYLNKPEEAEAALRKAAAMNRYAATPLLGFFYAGNNRFKEATAVFQDYLSSYLNPNIAVRQAELLALTSQTDQIKELAARFQQTGGRQFMIVGYYLDAIVAFLKDDKKMMEEALRPTRLEVVTPFAALMALYVDVSSNNPAAAEKDYETLLKMPPFLDFRSRARTLLLAYIADRLRAGDAPESMLRLANMLQGDESDILLSRVVLLCKLRNRTLTPEEMEKALKTFPADPVLLQIAAEYQLLRRNYAKVLEYAELVRRSPGGMDSPMMLLEIAALERLNRLDDVSRNFRRLLQKDPSAQNFNAFWRFASGSGRKNDLQYLAGQAEKQKEAEKYLPFCRAELLLLDGKEKEALDLLETVRTDDPALLFHAAYQLARHNRNQAAIRRYAELPADFPQKELVLLNLSELYAAEKQPEKALDYAEQAWKINPNSELVQICYATRLQESGNSGRIPAVIRMSGSRANASPALLKLWIPAMERNLRTDFENRQYSRMQESCRQLLIYDPSNKTAKEYLHRVELLQKKPAGKK